MADPSRDKLEGEQAPRAWIFDSNTGESRPVSTDEIVGLDDWIANWQSNVEMPHELTFSGWQMADESHEAGSGRPAYRLVHKTVRKVFVPPIEFTFPNLRITFNNGPVTFGAPIFHGTLPGRTAGSYMLPESGVLRLTNDGKAEYDVRPNMHISVEAHQETTPDVNYVEILYELPDGDWGEYGKMLAAGRTGVSSLTALLDFLAGPRVVGPVLTEEVGEVFDDWHWNRWLAGRTVSLESQAQLEVVDGPEFMLQLSSAINRRQNLDDAARARTVIASEWYWQAEAEAEAVQRYIFYWLVVEALELKPNSTDIGPVKRRVAALLQVDRHLVSGSIGRMYGIRGKLVHGSMRNVNSEQVDRVKALAHSLLEWHTRGSISQKRLVALRLAALE